MIFTPADINAFIALSGDTELRETEHGHSPELDDLIDGECERTCVAVAADVPCHEVLS